MRNWWIRFGCFLTGYNYFIVNTSSEVVAKAVKRYTAALLIVCILWAFIGYTFAQRYLQSSFWGSIASAGIAVVIIIQIERQIILSISPGIGLYLFRGLLALMMASLGAVIIDQIILKEDIELEKINFIDARVNKSLPLRTFELRTQIFSIDTVIQQKESEKQALIAAVAQNPWIRNVTTQTQSIPVSTTKQDSLGRNIPVIVMKPSTTVVVGNVPNPKQALILPLDTIISGMRRQKAIKEDLLLNIRPEIKKEVSSKIGFLDELKVMYSLISTSGVAFGFWLLWLLFLLSLEMLVLFSKLGEKSNDYEKTVLHQMNLQMKKLDALAKQA